MTSTIGILGGMGPEATADLYRKIIKETRARKDQDHIKTIIISDPKIPDRTAFIAGRGPSPLPRLIDGLQKLEVMGSGVIAIPCNTSHFFYSELQNSCSIPILNMIEETADFTNREHPGIKKVGILGTSGTIATRLYDAAFAKHDICAVSPEPVMQRAVMEAIYGSEGIKAGGKIKARNILLEVLERLRGNGAEAIIMGCTEIPLALKQRYCPIPLIDPTSVLAIASLASIRGAERVKITA